MCLPVMGVRMLIHTRTVSSMCVVSCLSSCCMKQKDVLFVLGARCGPCDTPVLSRGELDRGPAKQMQIRTAVYLGRDSQKYHDDSGMTQCSVILKYCIPIV